METKTPGSNRYDNLYEEMINLYVDCWTSGNPGPGGYRVTDQKGKVYSERSFPDAFHSNNFYELSGVLLGYEYANDLSDPLVIIYTDSDVALSWIRGKPGKNIMHREEVLTILSQIEVLRNRNKDRIFLKKWDSRKLGEIPADYGRKPKRSFK